MKLKVLKSLCVLGLAAATLAFPAQLQAQNTNKTVTTKKATTSDKKDATTPTTGKKVSGHPFHGKLAAVDKVARTITLGKSTYQITSETKIKKGDKPATFEDGVIGEDVSGYVKPTEDGKWAATTVTFGAKTDTSKKKTKETATKDTTTKSK